jgi:microsomal dipeptidase-like Zn-dependent dipeptidase
VCGGEQQPACEIFGFPTCKAGYKVVDDAWPWGCLLGVCYAHCTLDHDPIAEPDCDCTVPDLSQEDPSDLWGFADIHAHQFTNEGFGGASMWGQAFHPEGIESALAPCGWQKQFKTGFYPLGLFVETKDLIAERGWASHGTTFLEIVPPTGYHLMSWIIDGKLHQPHGAPLFDDWPRFDRSTHHKMYYRWLERAYKGGLRLMVMLAVNNEAQCRLPIALRRKEDPEGRSYGCDDDRAILRQIDKAYELEKFIDLEDDGELNGSGWYRIVLSPDDPDPARPGARQVISSGKLAVVLGIEVDSLFGCNDENQDCNFEFGREEAEEYIKGELDRWYGQGARHFFPVHLINNRFAGTALYQDLWAVTNMLTNAASMEFWDCSGLGVDYTNETIEGVQDALEGTLNVLEAILEVFIPGVDLGFIMDLFFGDVELSDYSGICNGRGLTPEGAFLIDELMRRDLIIDTDHMSYYAFEQTLGRAFTNEEARPYGYPLISGHTYLRTHPQFENQHGATKTETHRTDDQIARLLGLGGIVAPIMPRQECNTTVNYAKRYGHALGLARSAPQIYGEEHPGIAFGSDFGAMFHEPGPRFGSDAESCKDSDVGGPLAVRTRLDYGGSGFEIFPGRGRFKKQETGDRDFDYNEDGLAHVGLLPDFMADLKNVGVIEDDLDPLFRSAETYIRMWERIENCTPDLEPPEVLCNAAQTITPPGTPVTFTASAADKCGLRSILVREPYCFKINGEGKEVPVPCHVSIEGETITILNSGGVGTFITWEAFADDDADNSISLSCEVEVVNPGQGHCPPGQILDLAGWEIGWSEAFESCGTITAPDFHVLAPDGDVTFRAGEEILLGNGFQVDSGGRFSAEIEPVG